MNILITIINGLAWLLGLLVFISVILSYLVDPYHPVRRGIDRVVEPMLAPIRRILPPMGGLDFSPIVLIILIRILSNLIISLLLTLR